MHIRQERLQDIVYNFAKLRPTADQAMDSRRNRDTDTTKDDCKTEQAFKPTSSCNATAPEASTPATPRRSRHLFPPPLIY